MDSLRALPRARADRLAARFAFVFFIAFASVGAVLHLVIVADAAAAQRARIDGALAGGLVLLYALVLPLASRTAGSIRAQSRHPEGKTAQLSALLDQLPALVWATDTELRFTEAAGGLGIDPDRVRGMSLQDAFGTADPDHPSIAAHHRALGGEASSFETEFEGRTLQASVQPLREGGAVIGVVGAGFDVTERTVAERSLDRLQRQHALILESAGEGIVGVGIRGNATFVNPAAARMLGWGQHELLGRSVHAMFHHSLEDGSSYPASDCPVQRVLEDGRTREVHDEVYWCRDGTSFPVDYVAAPLRQGDQLVGAVLVFHDITQRKSDELELKRNFRMLRKSHEDRRRLVAQLVRAEEEERRRVASDIHDDSLQLMAAVAMHLYNVRRDVEDSVEASALESLEEAVREAIRRLRHLLFELRPPTLDRDGLSAALRMLLEETLKVDGIECRLESKLSAEPPQELRTILYRIAQEALANVRKHAMATRVDVVLEEEGRGYLVRIVDDGRGLTPEEQRPRPGHLGISGMRERAEMTGGWFRLEGIPGHGTAVEFWVPYEQPVGAAAVP